MNRFLFILITVAFTNFSNAQNNYLDKTFNGTGYRTESFGADWAECQALAVQADGKILLGGFMRTTDDRYTDKFIIARLNADGSTDSTFGTNGVVRTMSNYVRESIVSLAIDNRGNILAAGTFAVSNDSCGFLARFLPDGSLDSTFADHGIFKVDTAQAMGASDLKLQQDGKILVCGLSENAPYTACTILRLLPDGSPDPGFGKAGWAKASSLYDAQAMALQPDGKIVAIGTANSGIGVARFHSDGRLDANFGTNNGSLEFGLDNKLMYCGGVHIQPDGKILVSGTKDGGFPSRFMIARFQPDGEFDKSFGDNGISVEPESTRYVASSVLLPDGRIVLAGGEYAAAALSRFLPNGTRDNSLDTDGHISLRFNSSNTSIARLALLPDGRIVAAGGNQMGGGSDQFCVMRFVAADPLGINSKIKSADLIEVFPNPVKEKFIVKYSSTQNGAVKMTMTDVTGRVVQSWEMNGVVGANAREFIVAPSVVNGLYFLQISGMEKGVRVIVNK
jgi:uncharacterized delta-60 repeat protein